MIDDSLKIRITRAILAQIPKEYEIDLDSALLRWWLNIRNDGGLRLSDIGDMIFKIAEIEYFDFSLKNDTKNYKAPLKFVLELNNKIACPYYLTMSKDPSIRIYDSKVAMMIGLYGNIFDYVAQTKRRT